MADKNTQAEAEAVEPQEEETKRQRFVRLATKRMDNALVSVARIRTLANPSSYEYTENDVLAIEKALKEAVTKTVDALREGTPGETGGFSFGE